MPSPGGTVSGHFSLLEGVRCTSAGNCWAVGEYYRGDADLNQALYWNGKKWFLIPAPTPGGTLSGDQNELFDVVCPSNGSPASSGTTLPAPVAGLAAGPSGGYWLVTQNGQVLSYGAPSYGSLTGQPLTSPVVGIAAEPDGRGYLIVTAKGSVYNFGSAKWYGSPASSVVNLSSPVVGIATWQASGAGPQPTGYYVVCANGDVYNFGAALPGSLDGLPLPSPIAGIGAR